MAQTSNLPKSNPFTSEQDLRNLLDSLYSETKSILEISRMLAYSQDFISLGYDEGMEAVRDKGLVQLVGMQE